MKSANKKINNNIKEKLPFSSSRYDAANFEKFQRLEINRNIKSIDRTDLPNELSDKTCEFIDLFRRMTSDEETEWEFYIDYENNEIIHCLHGQATFVRDWIHSGLMENRNILSIHNHPKGTYSAPSPENFEILGHEFENYEIICAETEYWILKAKGYFKNRESIQEEICRIFESVRKSNRKTKNQAYENKLTKYINNLNLNIKLTKGEYK